MRKNLTRILDLLFPLYCLGCETLWSYICSWCKKQLVPHPDRCPFCHRVMDCGQTCYDCFVQHRHLAGVMVAFVYTDMIKKLILQLKFFHRYDVVGFLADRLSRLIQTNPSFTEAQAQWMLFVTFVPSHRRRRWVVKGYNQSELLARHVASNIEVPLIQSLKKQKHTRSQTKRSRKERLTNLLGAFTQNQKVALPPWATLMVIDDITTTWATLDEVAKQRKHHYPSIKVRWVVVGRHWK